MTLGARIVGIGEATHGTHEFRELMLAVVRRAAEDDAPLAVALEMPFHDGIRFDAWVRRAWHPADPRLHNRAFTDSAVNGDPYWIGATEEYRTLFTWIRTHNAGVAPERAIRVYGIDMCIHPVCSDDLAAYFADVDPAFAAEARALLVPLRARMHALHHEPGLAAAARANLATLRSRLLAERDTYIARRGADAHLAALRLVWMSERRVDLAFVDDPGASTERDTLMADNVGWISDQMGADARLLVLAHNGHLGRARDILLNGRESATRHLGEALSRRYGAQYVVVHTTFDRGRFLAQRIRRRRPELAAFPIGPAPDGTLESTFRTTDTPYALDIRTASVGDGPLARYLRTHSWHRVHGYAWRRVHAFVPIAWSRVAPAEEYDILVYFPSTTANTPLTRSPRPSAGAA
jgi:erythromycin esterase